MQRSNTLGNGLNQLRFIAVQIVGQFSGEACFPLIEEKNGLNTDAEGVARSRIKWSQVEVESSRVESSGVKWRRSEE